ncbi:MAG TPA: FHA domain-containing protein [Methylophilaceae bacterium]|jgi:pSer/pThr/pTyr-binding forkhead associated (FHA) protein|nr:FHA domain-containing protein [Methylophilaceae bacterium]
MSKLILTLDGALLGEYPLEKKCLTIGRRATNDIHIDNLAVSGDHARVITVGDETRLEDLESTNGSVVNGKKVQKQTLRHGDVVAIGKYKLTYVNESAAGNGGTKQVDFENTIMMQPSAEEEIAEEASAAAQAEDAAEAGGLPPARVQVLNGPATGKEMQLTKTLTTLGKAGAQVAVITRRPQGYFITHVEGEHSPDVNGNPIGMQAYELHDHDVIELAGVKMEFYLADQ